MNGDAGEWREEATARTIILLGDAPPKDTELRAQVLSLAANVGVSAPPESPSLVSIAGDIETESVTSELALTSFAVTSTNTEGISSTIPVEIFTVIIGDDPRTNNDFSDLAAETGGQSFVAANASEVVDRLMEVIGEISNDATIIANNDTLTTDEDTSITISAAELITNDISVGSSDSLNLTGVDNPINGTVLLNEDGDIEFIPDADFNGTASFDYTVTDGIANATASVEVTVIPVNDILIANNDTFTTDEDIPLTILANELFSNDIHPDLDRNLSISVIDNLVNGAAIIDEDGNVEFTPDVNFNGTASFDYTVTDGIDSETASVTVVVNSVYDAPLANNDSVTTDEDIPLTILVTELLSNDINIETEDSLSVIGIDSFVNGTAILNEDGNVEFTPDVNFNGTASFDYTITDGIGNATASVEVVVNPVNDAPILTEQIFDMRITQGAPIGIVDLEDKFEDIEQGDVLSYFTSVNANFEPFGLNFTDNRRLLILGYPSFTFRTSFEVGVRVTDSEGESIETDFTIFVVNASDNGDSLEGGDGNDFLAGQADNDTLIGGNGNDTLLGEDDNDFLAGQQGNDTLIGGNENDTLLGEGDNDYLNGQADNDSLNGGNGNDTLIGEQGNDSLLGGNNDDSLNGGDGNDTMNGGIGADVLDGQNDNDRLVGNNGNDTLSGGAGADSLWGQNDDDSLVGGDGNDTLSGGAGDDILNGQNDDDRLIGGDGNDTLSGGAGADSLWGQNDDDSLVGGDGNDILGGGIGADVLDGQNDDDRLKGGDGNDTLIGGTGADSLWGQNDDDSLVGEDGNDTIIGGEGNDILNGQNNDDRLFGQNGNDTLNGGAGDDLLNGQNDNDSLTGENGNDRLVGSDGNDTLNGGLGFDTLIGGLGSDRFVIVSGLTADLDIIQDYQDGFDLLDLTGGLSFGNLTINQNVANTEIIETATNEILATLIDIDAVTIDNSDFV